MVRAIEDAEGVLIFDATIQEKPYTDENELISWHFDHSKNRTVKGLNLLNCVYHAQGVTLPVAHELILRQAQEQTHRLLRRENGPLEAQKHVFQKRTPPLTPAGAGSAPRMLSVCQQGQVAYRYVLADSWFSAKENLHFIRHGLDKHFVIALKSNRTAALSYEAKRQGTFSRLEHLKIDWSHTRRS